MIRHILLSATEIRQIAALKKTMHLVPVRHNRKVNPAVALPCPYRTDELHPVDTWKWHTEIRKGKTVRHKIPASPEPRLFVQISSVTRTTIGDIGYSDARHLGHRTTLDFAHHWMVENDTGYTHTDRPDDGTIDHAFARHSSRPVWLISMQIADAPRFLAVHGDYTYDPRESVYGEPQPVDPVTQEKITAGKLLNEQQRRRQDALRARPKLVSALADLRPLSETDARIKNHAAIIKRQIAAIDKIIEEAA